MPCTILLADLCMYQNHGAERMSCSVQQRSIFRPLLRRSLCCVRPLTMNYAAIHTTGGRRRDLSETTLVLSGEGGKEDGEESREMRRRERASERPVNIIYATVGRSGEGDRNGGGGTTNTTTLALLGTEDSLPMSG